MNLPGKRLLLGTAIAAAALGVGGLAYAAGNDPAADQGYVTVEEGPGAAGQGTDNGQGTGSPGDGSSTSPGDGSSAAPQGSGGATRDGKDCPEKAGGGEGQGAQPTQPQAQPEQNQPQPEQNQPQQTEPDVAGNA